MEAEEAEGLLKDLGIPVLLLNCSFSEHKSVLLVLLFWFGRVSSLSMFFVNEFPTDHFLMVG